MIVSLAKGAQSNSKPASRQIPIIAGVAATFIDQSVALEMFPVDTIRALFAERPAIAHAGNHPFFITRGQ